MEAGGNVSDQVDDSLAVAALAQRIWHSASPFSVDCPLPHTLLWEASARKSAGQFRVYRGNLVLDGAKCDNALIIPMFGARRTIQNLYFLCAISKGRFLPGGRVAGTYYGWGMDRSTIVVGRGFMQAARIYATTGHAVAIAFTAENIPTIVVLMRRRYPVARVVTATAFESATAAAAAMPDEAATAPVAPLDSPGGPRGAPPSSDRNLLPVAAARLLSWIERKRLARFTTKQVIQRGPGIVRLAVKAKDALRILVERGWLLTEDERIYRLVSANCGAAARHDATWAADSGDMGCAPRRVRASIAKDVSTVLSILDEHRISLGQPEFSGNEREETLARISGYSIEQLRGMLVRAIDDNWPRLRKPPELPAMPPFQPTR